MMLEVLNQIFTVGVEFHEIPNSGFRICVRCNDWISWRISFSRFPGSMRKPRTYFPTLLSVDSITRTLPNLDSRTLNFIDEYN